MWMSPGCALFMRSTIRGRERELSMESKGINAGGAVRRSERSKPEAPKKRAESEFPSDGALSRVLRVIRNPYRDLERELGYRFRRSALLETALVHRSFRFENAGVEYDNQRLEFLGDAALGLAAAAWLFERNADCNEGRLTSMRSQVTSGKALCHAANRINLGHYMRIGKGEEGSGGRQRHSNLEDALEAIIGAAYVDGGMRAVTTIFTNLFGAVMETMDDDHWAGNPKGRLQEYVQRELGVNLSYRLISREGPAHAPVFVVEAVLPDGRLGRGSAPNKQQAESDAAAELLAVLMESGGTRYGDVTL